MEHASITSFRDLYRSHYGLVRFALREFRLSPEDQEDVLQEAFVRLFREQGRVAPERVKGFLVITARNLVIDRLRQTKARKTDPMGTDVGADKACTWLESAQVERECHAAGELLDEMGGTASGATLRLFYRDGLLLREIAERTGVPVGTVAARLSRLRRRLKVKLVNRIAALA